MSEGSELTVSESVEPVVPLRVQWDEGVTYLEHRGDGSVWCIWPDGHFVQVVKLEEEVRRVQEASHYAQQVLKHEEAHYMTLLKQQGETVVKLRAVLERITAIPSAELIHNVAREALEGEA